MGAKIKSARSQCAEKSECPHPKRRDDRPDHPEPFNVLVQQLDVGSVIQFVQPEDQPIMLVRSDKDFLKTAGSHLNYRTQ